MDLSIPGSLASEFLERQILTHSDLQFESQLRRPATFHLLPWRRQRQPQLLHALSQRLLLHR